MLLKWLCISSQASPDNGPCQAGVSEVELCLHQTCKLRASLHLLNGDTGWVNKSLPEAWISCNVEVSRRQGHRFCGCLGAEQVKIIKLVSSNLTTEDMHNAEDTVEKHCARILQGSMHN